MKMEILHLVDHGLCTEIISDINYYYIVNAIIGKILIPLFICNIKYLFLQHVDIV